MDVFVKPFKIIISLGYVLGNKISELKYTNLFKVSVIFGHFLRSHTNLYFHLQ
jgi:hypothetical protein